MGVKGLQTYIENYCPDACYSVSIKGLIDTYRRETGREPVIVVDGSSCLRYLYGSLEWILGGQLKEYVEKVQAFVKAFETLGAKLVFFFDGPTIERKRPVWIQRRLKTLEDVYKIFDSLNKYNKLSYIDNKLFQLPAGLGSWTRFVIKNVTSCEVFTSIRECDEEIAEYARNKQCFAVLGQDTDYIIFEGAQYYFSIMKLNLSTMTTLNYNRWALARHLGILPNQLPILASLIGNDIILADDLKTFHNDICSRPDRRYGINSRISYDVLFNRVARFINTLPSGNNVFGVLPDVANRVFCDKRKAALLNESIRSYSTETSSHKLVEDNSEENWSQVMSFARRRHVCCQNPSLIWGVMNGLPFESSTPLEDYREIDLPPSALALRPLRQRIYWLLLNEKPKADGETLTVKEWCMHGENSLQEPALVKPVNIQGIEHPGLLALWNGTKELQWKVFCAAVSPRLDPKEMSELPPYLVVPAAVLTYFCYELESPMLESWEVEALITQAVILEEYSTQQLSELDIPHVHVRAVRISTLFMRGVTNMKLLLGTCGSPVPKIELSAWKYFDGKLFHSVYHKTKLGMKYEDHCRHKVALMERFLKMQHIVLGSPQK